MIERRYEVLEALGTGGFGTVYRARYQGEGGFSQMVALKILNPEMAGVDEIASRLRDEARVLGLLRHRAIVQVHRLVQLDDSWTVVMEFVEGADLSRVLETGQRVPVGPALEIVSEVAAALHVAWTAPGPGGRPLRLLHRDIKPSNIQITPVGEVKVLDFGIARADFAQREAMTQKLAFGSTEYMSPERLDMRDGPAADVYSLGAVLYEILTGKGLGRTSAVRDRHVPRIDDALATLSQAIGSSHTAIIELVGDMLTWDPKNRPTARVIERRALTLRSHIAGEPLRFWAEDHIKEAMAARPKVLEGQRVGSVFVERDDGRTSSERLSRGSWDGVIGSSADGVRKRRPLDPTDAPSIALAIGAQAKRPVQLGPVAESVVAPAKRLPPILEHPSSPTLVALIEPSGGESFGAQNLADDDPDLVPSEPIEPTLDFPEQPASGTTTQPTIAAVADVPLDPPRRDMQDDTQDWESAQRSSGVPKVLFLVAGLVLFGGLLGTWIKARMADSLESEPLQQVDDGAPVPQQPSAAPVPALAAPAPVAPAPVAPAPVAPAPVAHSPVAHSPGLTSGTVVGNKIEASTDPSVADGWSLPAVQTEAASAAPAPTAVTPVRASAPVRPATPVLARIRLTGDPAHVTLKGVRGTFDAARGKVPAGTYQVWVRFDGRVDLPLSQTGSVTLKTGETVTLRCDQSFAECTKQ